MRYEHHGAQEIAVTACVHKEWELYQAILFALELVSTVKGVHLLYKICINGVFLFKDFNDRKFNYIHLSRLQFFTCL